MTRMTVHIGNTCGPSFQPVKVAVEYTVEGIDLTNEDEVALQTKTMQDVYDLCYEALLRFKGEEEAKKYQAERAGKDGV